MKGANKKYKNFNTYNVVLKKKINKNTWRKNQNLEKVKKIAAVIIISHMCTKNHNNMRYSSWDKGWDRQNFLSFLSFYLTYNLKNENFEKMKHLEVSFYTSAPKIMIICYTGPKIWHVMDVYNYFPFSAILCNFIPLRAPKNKIFKKLKKHLAMFIKIMIIWCTVPEILSEQTDSDKVTYQGGCPI